MMRCLPRNNRGVRFLLIVSLVAAAGSPVAAQESPPYAVVVDRDLTPAAGAIDVLAAQRVLIAVEDRLGSP